MPDHGSGDLSPILLRQIIKDVRLTPEESWGTGSNCERDRSRNARRIDEAGTVRAGGAAEQLAASAVGLGTATSSRASRGT